MHESMRLDERNTITFELSFCHSRANVIQEETIWLFKVVGITPEASS